MNKLSLILLAALASTGALANDTAESPEEININNSLSLIESFAAQTQEDAIYAYAENIFNEISANVKEAIDSNAEQDFAIRLTSL